MKLPHWIRSRLSARIAAMSLGLLLLVQAAGFAVLDDTVDGAARQQLGRELDRGAEIWSDMLRHQADQIELAGRMAAKDFGFQRVLFGAGRDEETVVSSMESLMLRVDARIAAVVDTDGTVSGVIPGPAAEPEVRRLAAAMAVDKGMRQVHVLAGRPYHLVATEILAPVRRGWLLFGYPIDGDMLKRLGTLAGMEAVILDLRAGGGGDVVATSLDLARSAALRLPAGTGEVDLAGTPMLLKRVPLGATEVVLLRSISEAEAPYRQLQKWLLGISLLGVLFFGVASSAAARRVTTPLRSLVRASERLERGDYTEPLAHQEREDEIGDLAKAFDHMRVGIAERAAEVHQLAYFDQLTGLPNRTSFRDSLHAAIQTGAVERLAVVMLNLNRFKPVNQALGQQPGDRLLAAVADRLKTQMLREGDVVFRLGSDEFALMLSGCDEEQAVATASRVACAFELPLKLDENTVDLSAAFGVAVWPQHVEDIRPDNKDRKRPADYLLLRAEIAMHEAKRRAEVVMVYETAMDPDSATTLSLLSELRRAIDRSELRLFLQPKFALDGRMLGAEALVRWQHPVRGMVPPLAFIPFAEKTGFVRQLTTWIFDDAARQWPVMRDAGLDRVSVNLSARDLMDLGLPDRLAGILARHGVPAEAFCLEITESAIMDDPARAKNILVALKTLGFKLSIDDFGEGYTSLQHLRHLPVDELKVDGIFVKKMDSVPQDENVVRSVIELAHNLGLTVVAEGVENAAVWHRLAEMGCDEAQGFFMSRPLPVDELKAFGQRWHAALPVPVPGVMPVPAAPELPQAAGATLQTPGGEHSPAPAPSPART